MVGDWPDNRYQPTVSHSAIAKFKTCDRAYALQYHHNIIPDITARFEYKRESKLQPLNCFPGSIFHETLQNALTSYRNTGVFPTNLMDIARQYARDYIHFSNEWVADVQKHPILGGLHKYWPDHEFAQPIESFYYEGGFPPGYRATVKDKLELWFDHFITLLPSLPFHSVEPKHWLFPREVSKKVPWFVHNDEFAVYAAFDFLTKQDELVTIYDWKTGKRQYGELSVADQLMTYAAYAVERWKVTPEQIKLYAVWVDDGSVQEVDCDPWEIDRIQKLWETHQHDWRSKLSQVNGDAGRLLQLFPMTQDRRTCARCSFRSYPGRQRAAGEAASLPQAIDFYDG